MTIFTQTVEPHRDKTNKMACAPSEDSDQPGHPPSLIRVFAVRLKKARILSYPLSAQWRLWSDWADAQADLSLGWAPISVCWFCHEAAHFFVYYAYPYMSSFETHYFSSNILDILFHTKWYLFEMTSRLEASWLKRKYCASVNINCFMNTIINL